MLVDSSIAGGGAGIAPSSSKAVASVRGTQDPEIHPQNKHVLERTKDELFHEMTQILKREDLDSYSMLELFNDLQTKYLDYEKHRPGTSVLTTTTTPPNDKGGLETPPYKTKEEEDGTKRAALKSIGVKYRDKASHLLDLISKHPEIIRRGPRGEMIFNEAPIAGSNFDDLIYDAVTPSKQNKPRSAYTGEDLLWKGVCVCVCE